MSSQILHPSARHWLWGLGAMLISAVALKLSDLSKVATASKTPGLSLWPYDQNNLIGSPLTFILPGLLTVL